MSSFGKYCKLLPLLVWCNFFVLKQTTAEFYTAVAELEDLLATEALIINIFKTHIARQEEKLEFLKRRITYYEKEHEKAKTEALEYVANPVNIFLLIKRLTVDWKFNKTYISKDVYEEMSSIAKSWDFKLPTEDDLGGAARALARLQETYNLNAEALANGELNRVKLNSELSSDNCFELGRQLYKSKDYKHSISWMKEALQKYQPEDTGSRTSKWQILEYLTHSLYMEGDLQSAYEFTTELLSVSPNPYRAEIGLHHHYKSKLLETLENQNNDQDENVEEWNMKQTDLYINYQLLCRKAILQQFPMPGNISSQLKCRYTNKNNPYLLIAPFKEEEALLKPRILIYHDVMYSHEIENLLNLSKPQLSTAEILNNQQEIDTGDSIRSCKNACLTEEAYPRIATIKQRVADMTSLTMESADELQICNYGLAGHYLPHTDYFPGTYQNGQMLTNGNRIATVLFYMSDVAQGGATVFPILDVALQPKKGTAVFWYNLHSSGVPDSLTFHGACPVLQGSKWVSTFWIREHGQEFRRPCDPADGTITNNS